jgi:uncharacterized membrane protein YjjP (DUF1212 family)
MAGRKSKQELRVERITWFALVAIFIVANLIPEDTAIPNGVTPLLGGIVLIFSGIYQYSHKWRVNFTTWIAGTLMLVMAFYNFTTRPDLNLSFMVIILVALVIAVGVFTNET